MMSDTTLTPDWNTINKALREPFDPAFISFRPQGNAENGKAEILAYIDARDVQDRLDEAVGAGNWSFDWEPVQFDAKGEIALAKGRLTIHGVTKSDVGTKSSFSPSKGCISDALKRAAAQWGIARYLYDLPKTYAQVEGKGRISPAVLQQLRDKLPKPGNITGRAQFDEAADESSEATTTAKATTKATQAASEEPPLHKTLQAILDKAPDLKRTYIEAGKYGLRGDEFFKVFLRETKLPKEDLTKPLSIAHKQTMAAYVAKLAADAKTIAARTPDLSTVATPELRP